MEKTKAANVLILGESDTGKTHYGAQLLQRLNQQNCRLRMRQPATNLTVYEATLNQLNKGCTADHTAATTYEESFWPVVDKGGAEIDLYWPDYGGEQLRDLIDKRIVTQPWRNRLSKSTSWILFIRLQKDIEREDIFTRPLEKLHQLPPNKAVRFRISAQARLVELLQILLQIRRVGTVSRINSPSLTILLSCWDELHNEDDAITPSQRLFARLPLLSDFVAANWLEGAWCVYGLSSLGKELKKDCPDEGYIDLGPGQFGYVVRHDGVHDPDLTLPIAQLAE